MGRVSEGFREIYRKRSIEPIRVGRRGPGLVHVARTLLEHSAHRPVLPPYRVPPYRLERKGGGVPDSGVARGLVLVVEDEKAIADLVRLYLSREGFGVHVESDGRAGLAAARRLHPVAIVLDVALPGIDGTELCRQLRLGSDWTPVLFVTA